jgi:16S rRNA (cytosine967-C5)-methyltransferase
MKKYFRQHSKLGSGDRRTVSNLVYSWYRCGGSRIHENLNIETIAKSYVVVHGLDKFGQNINSSYGLGIEDQHELAEQRWSVVFANDKKGEVFPFYEKISQEIDKAIVATSLFEQPMLWIRIRSGYEEKVRVGLRDMNIDFVEHSKSCLGMPSSKDLSSLDERYPGAFEVQDISSQESISLMKPTSGEKWWDTCAASGGKSMLLYDRMPSIRLFCSDERATTLDALSHRMKRAGIKNYSRLRVDMTELQPLADAGSFPTSFDGILMDLPCSGSGTWGRSPEMAESFTTEQLENYANKQRQMVLHALQYLAEGGRLIYMTCSVFAEENEDNLKKICERSDLKVGQMTYFNFIDKGGNCLFGAVLRRN